MKGGIMIDEDIIIQEEELTKLESKAIESYIEDIYSKKVPEPVPPSEKDLSFWRIAGIEATLFTISGVAIAVYSAIRTGGLFFIMETLLLREFGLDPALINTFSLSAMITSLGAFELYVLADGFSKGRENKSLKRSDIGLYASLGVIVLAGIFTGLGLVPQMNETIKIVFYTITAVVTAIAGGLVALFSGENIGFTVLRVEKIREKLIKSHAENHLRWKEGAIKSYQSSHYAVGSKKANDFIENLNKVKKVNVIHNDLDEINFIEDKKNNAFVIYNMIVKFVKDNRRLPKTNEMTSFSTNDLKNKLALSKYIVTNENQLLRNKLVNENIIEKARSYYEENKEFDV